MEKIFLINIKDQLQFLKLTIKIIEMIRIKKIKIEKNFRKESRFSGSQSLHHS